MRIVRCNLEGVHPIKWKSQFSGMTVSHLAQLRQLQDVNAKLKRMYAEMALDVAAMKELIAKKL